MGLVRTVEFHFFEVFADGCFERSLALGTFVLDHGQAMCPTLQRPEFLAECVTRLHNGVGERLALPFASLVPLQHEGARSVNGLPVVLHLFGDEAGSLDDWFADEPLPADLYSLGEPRDSVCHLGSPVLPTTVNT